MEGNVDSQDDLYRLVQQVDWNNYLNVDNFFAVDSTENQSNFKNTMFISMKVKDAIVDQLRTSDGKRPSISLEKPDLLVNVHVFKDNCVISLDSSAYSLHKRGYKISNVFAPLNEILAAALINFSKWNADKPFIDGMTGGATIAIEACMRAKNVPAGYYSDGYGFMKWKNFDKKLWSQVVDDANSKIIEISQPIIAIEIDNKAYESAKLNIEEAGFSKEIKLVKADFFEYKNEYANGIIMLNPPYGERLSVDDVQRFYKRIGDTFKQNFKGFEAYVITSNAVGFKSLGLKTSSRMIVYNGGVECRFLKYELYEGTKKHS
jgi:putative N6-adenine-specific DNA methylase